MHARFVIALAGLIVMMPLSARAAQATLAWDPPTTNEDGSPLTDLTSYRVYYGTSEGPPYDGKFAIEGPSPIDVLVTSFSDPSKPEFKITVPSCMKVFFAVTAVDSAGTESKYSNVAGKTIAPKPSGLAATRGSDGSVEVRWEGLAANDTGGLASYKVHYRTLSTEQAKEGPSPITVSPKSTSLLITGLKADEVLVKVESVCTDLASKETDEVKASLSSPIEAQPGGRDQGDLVGGCEVARTEAAPPALVVFALLALIAGLRPLTSRSRPRGRSR